MISQEYKNKEVLKILKDFSEEQDISFNYHELYELLEDHLL